MADKKFKLILCDLGNVLLHFDHRIAVRRIQNFTDKGFEEIFQLFFDSPLTEDYEEGRISSIDFYNRLDQVLRFKNLGFEEFGPIWNEIFFDNEGIVELLNVLKRKYRLHLISNINELHYDYIAGKFPQHMALFDGIYLSYRIGRRKPHQEIYHSAIEESGYNLQEVVYVDDRADLIQEARKLGITSILFRNLDDFKNQLKKMRILP